MVGTSPNVHDDWERLELKGGRGSATGPTRQPDESPGRDWWECESCGEGDYERDSPLRTPQLAAWGSRARGPKHSPLPMVRGNRGVELGLQTPEHFSSGSVSWGNFPGFAGGVDAHRAPCDNPCLAESLKELEAFLMQWAVTMGEMSQYMSGKERAAVQRVIQETDEWLKTAAQQEANTAGVLRSKKKTNLRKMCKVLERRKAEAESRPAALLRLADVRAALSEQVDRYHESIRGGGVPTNAERVAAARDAINEAAIMLQVRAREQEALEMFEDPVLLVWEIEKTTEKVQAALADFLFDANYAAKSASSVDPTDLHMQPSPGSLCIVPEESVPSMYKASSGAETHDKKEAWVSHDFSMENGSYNSNSTTPRVGALESKVLEPAASEPTKPASSPTGSGCFPSCSQVLMADGSWQRMDELRVGDRVLVQDPAGELVPEDVMLFAAQDVSCVERAYVEIVTSAGPSVLLSPGHYIPACPTEMSSESACNKCRLVRAEDVQPGWIVWIAERTAEQIDTSRKNGGCIRFTWKPTRIIKSQRCFERGRFAPLTCTSSSTLVVNRVLVSQYTDILASAAIRSIVPWLFIPLRFVYISIPLQIYTALVYNVPNWHDDITRCWEMLNIKDALG
mmetsp:Transcript_1406/g.2907  ORF Transcript_1406/g.2907 Transcript_1406/m.2907 type:complete len:625 (-) Transcript_1406:100-1974(-)